MPNNVIHVMLVNQLGSQWLFQVKMEVVTTPVLKTEQGIAKLEVDTLGTPVMIYLLSTFHGLHGI
jgi:hypothetical protein